MMRPGCAGSGRTRTRRDVENAAALSSAWRRAASRNMAAGRPATVKRQRSAFAALDSASCAHSPYGGWNSTSPWPWGVLMSGDVTGCLHEVRDRAETDLLSAEEGLAEASADEPSPI